MGVFKIYEALFLVSQFVAFFSSFVFILRKFSNLRSDTLFLLIHLWLFKLYITLLTFSKKLLLIFWYLEMEKKTQQQR